MPSSGEAPPAAAPAPEESRRRLESLVLPVVTKALSDPDAEVRSAATIALGKMGYARSFVDLQKALRDPHPDVRDGAILALGMIGEEMALEHLRPLMRDPQVRDRTRGFAALAIGLLGGERAAGELISFLAPEADQERVGGLHRTSDLVSCAVIALGHTGSPAAAEHLRRLYASGQALETTPRCCAALALARLGDRESIPLLLKGIRHAKAPMRQCAAIALGSLAAPTDEAPLAALARCAAGDEDDGARQFSLMALGRVGGPVARSALRGLLDSARGPDRTSAVLAVGVSGDLPCAPLLRSILRTEGDEKTRGAAATALGLLGDREAARALREAAFGKGQPEYRAHCLRALGFIGDEESAQRVRAVLADESDPQIRLAAAECLGILGDPGAVPLLAGLARKGSSVHVRAHSCYFLGLLGGEEAARALLDAVEDPEEQMVVRMHAVAGLGVLADRSPSPVLSGLGSQGNYLLEIDPLREVTTFL